MTADEPIDIEATAPTAPTVLAPTDTAANASLASLALRARARTLTKQRSRRTRWLRTAVLGSSDAIVSTASLVIGVTAAAASREATLAAGVLGLIAGAGSLAVREFVTVSAQRDTERADVALEARTLAADPVAEVEDLAQIYAQRGVDVTLARQVAEQLSARDRLGAPLRDELGELLPLPEPLQAAGITAASFALFAAIPVVMVLVSSSAMRIPGIAAISLVSLAAVGGLGARLGGAPLGRAILRMTLGGALAMALTGTIGLLVGFGVG